MPLFPPPEKFDDTSPMQDRTLRFTCDQLLRKAGFAIHARRAGREPVWRYMRKRGGDGRLYAESVAVQLVKKLAGVSGS